MTKAEFLSELSLRLNTLGEGERERFVSYYDEMLSDRMEDGMDESAAVSSLEPIPVIAERILNEAAPTAAARPAPKKARPGAGSIALIALGSPLWAPLLAAFAAVVFALTVALWAVWLALAAVCAALLISGAACALFGIGLLFRHPASGVFTLGAGFACAALGLLFYPPVRFAAVRAASVTVKAFKKLRARRKREAV